MRIANRGCQTYLSGRSPRSRSARRTWARRSWVTRSTASTSTSSGSASTQDYDYDESVADIREVIDAHPGLYRTTQTYLRERVKEVLSGSNESIVVRVFGPDIEVLTKKAEEITPKLAKIDGIVDPKVEQIEQIPQIEVEVDVAAAEALRDHARPRPPAVLRADSERGGWRHLPPRARHTTCTSGRSRTSATA